MKNEYYIGLDIGTSSVKGVLMQRGKEPVAFARSPFKYETNENGGVIISAQKYLNSCYEAIKSLCEKLPDGGEIVSLRASSASGNLLLIDKDFNPITPIVNWQDKSCNDEVSAVLGNDFDYESYYQSTGWAFDKKTFPLASLCRLKVNNPELLKKAEYVVMSTEYLYHTLCGNWGLSTSAGTPFYLIDQVSGKYNTSVLELFGLNENKLPPIVKVNSVIGKSDKKAYELCKLPIGTDILAGTFDHPSAARAVGVKNPGDLLLSCGTSWVGFYPLSSRELGVKNKMLIDPFLSENGGPWAGMVSLASVSAKIEEYIRKYISNEGNIFKTFEENARESSLGANGLNIYFDNRDDEKYIASFEKKHIARAIMEGVVKKLKIDLDNMSKGGVTANRAVMVGGPTENPLWKTVIEEIIGIKTEICKGAYAGAIGNV